MAHTRNHIDDPTIWDMLAWEELSPDVRRGSRGEGYTRGDPGGRDIIKYLSSILEASGYLEAGGYDPAHTQTTGEWNYDVDAGVPTAMPWELSDPGTTTEWDVNLYNKGLSSLLNFFETSADWQQVGSEFEEVPKGYEGFANMTEEQLKNFIMPEEYWKTTSYGEPKYGDDYDDLLKYYQALQEGFKSLPTSEGFDIEGKIADIETGGKRDIKAAYSGYIPGEIISRYAALQNAPGAEQKGEEYETAFKSDIYGIQRDIGRDVTGTYGDFEDEWFDAISGWSTSLS